MWIVEIPKYEYGRGFQDDRELFYFETKMQADEFAKSLQARTLVYFGLGRTDGIIRETK